MKLYFRQKTNKLTHTHTHTHTNPIHLTSYCFHLSTQKQIFYSNVSTALHSHSSASAPSPVITSESPPSPFSFLWLECTGMFHSSSDEKTLSYAKWKRKDFGYRSFSVQAPIVCSCSHPTLQFSLSSELLLKLFSLLLSTLNYFCLP